MPMLDEGSKLYAEAMRLMQTGETNVLDFRRAVKCFIKGARLFDEFCIQRLNEILRTSLYRSRLSSTELSEVKEAIQAGTLKLPPPVIRGIFGTSVRKPIDHAAGMTFQRKK